MPHAVQLRTIARGATAALALAFLPAVHAADDGNDDAKYRHTVMEAMGSSFGDLGLIFTNRVNQPDQLYVHAAALAASASVTPTLFPAGSEGGDALPLIWEEPEKVQAAAERVAEATAALAEAAKSGDRAATAKAFKEAGDSCKACHETYKAEDE